MADVRRNLVVALFERSPTRHLRVGHDQRERVAHLVREQVDEVLLEGVGALELVALGLHLSSGGGQVGGFAYDEQQRQQRGRGQQQRTVAESLPSRQRQEADRGQRQRQQHFWPFGARVDRGAVKSHRDVP